MNNKYPQIKCDLCGKIIPHPVKDIAIQICDQCVKDNQKLGVIKDSIIGN